MFYHLTDSFGRNAPAYMGWPTKLQVVNELLEERIFQRLVTPGVGKTLTVSTLALAVAAYAVAALAGSSQAHDNPYRISTQ